MENEKKTGLGYDEVTPEIISSLRESVGPDVPLICYKDKRKRYQAIFTPITHDLMKRIRTLVKEETIKDNLLPIYEVENLVFDECVLWPSVTVEDKENLPAGLIPNIVKSIQEASLFLDIDIFDRPLRPDDYSEIIRDFEFWGEPTEEEIETLKTEVPFELFRTVIDRWVFITRPMTRTDMRVVQAALDDQLALCKCVTVWPKEINWDGLPAGVIETLGKAIARLAYWGGEEPEISEL